MLVARLAPETPSIVAWCMRANSATAPFSIPSMIQNSQSGRDRSSWRPAMPPMTSISWSMRARLGHRDVADVVVEVEVGIVEPHRPVQVERHEREPLAELGQQRQPLGEVRLDLLERVAARHRRRVEQHDRLHLHRDAGVLQVQERRVHAAQPPHRVSSRVTARLSTARAAARKRFAGRAQRQSPDQSIISVPGREREEPALVVRAGAGEHVPVAVRHLAPSARPTPTAHRSGSRLRSGSTPYARTSRFVARTM